MPPPKAFGVRALTILPLVPTEKAQVTGFQGAQLAKKSFEHTRDITNANLNNQISSYNTAIEDRARARFVGEGRGENSAQEREYVARNRLTR